MSIFEALSSSKPTAEQGALRIKRVLAQAFQQVEIALSQVCQITERHGPEKIQSALGTDRAEVVALYGALKTVVEQHKPETSIPDMPR